MTRSSSLPQSAPVPAAEHGATAFRPDDAWQDDQVAQVYECSGRLVTHLGDWHTHPGGSVSPSRVDLSTLSRIAENPAARAPVPLMFIVAGGDPWTSAMWEWRPRRLWRWQLSRARTLRCRLWEPEPRGVVWEGAVTPWERSSLK